MCVFTHSHVFFIRTRSHTCCIRFAYVLPSGHACCLKFYISAHVFLLFLHIDGLTVHWRNPFFQWRAASRRVLHEFPRLDTNSLTILACAPRLRAQERRTCPSLRLAGLHVCSNFRRYAFVFHDFCMFAGSGRTCGASFSKGAPRRGG